MGGATVSSNRHRSRLSGRLVSWALLLAALSGCSLRAGQWAATVTPPVSPPQVPGTTPSILATASAPADAYEAARARMVQSGIIDYGISDSLVIEAMRHVPRHEFVPDEYLQFAYINRPLPIGYGQTISQPYIVALMTQELQVSSGDRVLEIGTGSGYQAAVLAEMGVEVFSIEIIEPLAKEAEQRLDRLGYEGVQLRNADGYYGWPEQAPFDAIIVTAAPDHVPQPLLSQLKIGGILVIPVGPVGGIQELWRIIRADESAYDSVSLGGVRFVPLTRQEQ